jgi:hypothetical protein
MATGAVWLFYISLYAVSFCTDSVFLCLMVWVLHTSCRYRHLVSSGRVHCIKPRKLKSTAKFYLKCWHYLFIYLFINLSMKLL